MDGIDQQKEFDTFNKKKESTEFKDQVRAKIVQLNSAISRSIVFLIIMGGFK